MIKKIKDREEALNTLYGIEGGQVNAKFIELVIETEPKEE